MKKKVTLLLLCLLLIVSACSSESAHDRAQTAMLAGEYETAVVEFDAALAEDSVPPERFEILTGRADAHAQLDDIDAALADYAAALSVLMEDGTPAGDFVAVRQARINLLLSNGRIPEAAAEYDALIDLGPPNSGELLLEQAELYADLENWDAVIASTDAALALNSADYAALAMRGEANLALRNFEAAIADLKASLQGEVDEATADLDRRGNLADAYFRLGQAMYSVGESDAAIASYSEALPLMQNAENEATVLTARGFVYSELDQSEAALADFEAAIALDAEKALAYAYRAAIYSDQAQYDAAIADADRAIALSTDLTPEQQSTIYHARGWANINLGAYANAVEDATLSIELAGAESDNVARTYSMRSRAYQQLSLYAEALADADRAIALGSADVGALDRFYAQRARLHLDVGNYETAIADAEAAIGIAGPTAILYELLAQSHWSLDSYDSAVINYQRAIEMDAENSRLYNNLGDIYYQLQEYGSAENAYRDAIRLDAGEGLYYEKLGFTLRDLENYAEALDAFTASLEIDPDAPYSWFGRGQVYYLLHEDVFAIPDLEKALEYDLPAGLQASIDELLTAMNTP